MIRNHAPNKGDTIFVKNRIAPRVFKGFCNPKRRGGKKLSLKICYLHTGRG
jgi:hypothetical protein